jgi:predicted nucleic acid-binding protein
MDQCLNVRFHFLDTSALVALLLYPDIKEEGSDAVYSYRKSRLGFYTHVLCIGEALQVLKTKYFSKPPRKVLSLAGYLSRSDLLRNYLLHKTICVTEDDWTDSSSFNRAFDVVRKYGIDLCDAYLIIAVKHGAGSRLVGPSRSILITGDEGLADAARQEGLLVWYFRSEPPPE